MYRNSERVYRGVLVTTCRGQGSLQDLGEVNKINQIKKWGITTDKTYKAETCGWPKRHTRDQSDEKRESILLLYL